MNENPLVSIVIPVYNREQLIIYSLRSAQCQTYPNIEIVIVDNQSTDNTWQILNQEAKKDVRIKIFQNENNLGPVRNWERCFTYACGEYVKILWSDDLIDPEFISETINVFEKDVAFVMSGITIFSSDEQEIWKSKFQRNRQILVSEYLDDVLIKNAIGFPVSPGCAIFRRTDLIDSLRIDIPNTENLKFEKYGAGNDLLLFLLTAVRASYTKIICIDKFLSMFRDHNGSISVNESHKLSIYYDWSKWYFIKNYYHIPSKIKMFKSQILINTYRLKYNKYLIKDIRSSYSFTYLLGKIYKLFIK